MDNEFKFVPTEMKQINTFHTPPTKMEPPTPFDYIKGVKISIYEDIFTQLENCASKVDLIEVMKSIKTKILELKKNG